MCRLDCYCVCCLAPSAHQQHVACACAWQLVAVSLCAACKMCFIASIAVAVAAIVVLVAAAAFALQIANAVVDSEFVFNSP